MEQITDTITVTYDGNEMPQISGRDLHRALEVLTAYKDWFPRMCERPVQIGVDTVIRRTVRVTPKGQQYFLNRYTKRKELEL